MDLLARIEAVAHDAPARTAYLYSNGYCVSYGALSRDIAVQRGVLRRHAHAYKRDVVLISFGNVSGLASTFLAALSAGLDALLVPESTAPGEIVALATRANAALIVTPLERSALGLSTPVLAGDELYGDGERHPASPRVGNLLLATSGSTDRPKIVHRTAASLDAVAANTARAIGITPGDVVLATVPLAHSYGLEHGVLAPLWAGATVALCDGLAIDAIRVAARGATIFPAVPAVIERLADLGETLPGLAEIRAVYSAGAPLPDAVRDRYVTRYGTPIGQVYGSTEIGTVTYRPGDRGVGVGWPMEGVSVRVGAAGDIAIRSPSMFAGYLNEPPDLVGGRSDLVDGHFITGDLGRVSHDGCLVIEGRSKLLIDTGGGKVNPLEVEAALQLHPGVAACVVVALRQSETVCRLRAIVVPRGSSPPPSAESLRAFVRSRLAPHKVPRTIEFASELPRSATGKVLRSMLGGS